MPPQLIRFYGTYRYDTPESLDRALSSARAQLDEEEAGNPAIGSLHGLVKHGTSLRIDILLPAIAEVRFAASDMFQTLALDAVEGAVEARHGEHHVDFFPCGGDD